MLANSPNQRHLNLNRVSPMNIKTKAFPQSIHTLLHFIPELDTYSSKQIQPGKIRIEDKSIKRPLQKHLLYNVAPGIISGHQTLNTLYCTLLQGAGIIGSTIKYLQKNLYSISDSQSTKMAQLCKT